MNFFFLVVYILKTLLVNIQFDTILMSTPSTNSMMLAMLLDRINQLEQRVQTTVVSTPNPIPTPSPTVETSNNNLSQDDQDTVDEDLDPRTKLMGIGKGEQVAILARVSTAEQKASNRDSLGSQVEACTEQMRA